MDFSRFDTRRYEMTDVRSGYAEWAATYEQVVRDEMDIRLLSRLTSVRWSSIECAVDLACGTGRIGAWLHANGVSCVDGVDITPEMLERARQQGIYRDLRRADLSRTPFEARAYDLATASLVDEHLPTLTPMYAEASRLLRAGGRFVVVAYHPQFIMTVGMPTHFHRADGEPVAIETYVHLLSDHVRAARDHGFALAEMQEGLVDDEYVAAKPNWERYRSTPVSVAFVWDAPGRPGGDLAPGAAV